MKMINIAIDEKTIFQNTFKNQRISKKLKECKSPLIFNFYLKRMSMRFAKVDNSIMPNFKGNFEFSE